MANVFIHGRSPTDKQISCRVDENGVLLTTTDIAGENGVSLVINESPLTSPPDIGGSINALFYGRDSVANQYHPIKIESDGRIIIYNSDIANIKTQTDKFQFDSNNNLKVIDSGASITGYALESTLTDIKNKTNLLNSYGGLFPNSVQVGVVNHDNRSYTYNGDGSSQISSTINTVSNKMGLDVFVSNQDAIGITCLNQITNYANETGGNLATIATNTNKIHSDTTNIDAIQVQVKNSSIDAHIFGSSDGVVFHHIKTNPNGVVATNAIVQDANGEDITGTTIGTSKNLDTATTLYSTNNGTTKTAITNTSGALNVNVSNSSIPVSGSVSISGTPSVNANITNSSVPVSISSPVVIASTAANTISVAGYDNSTLTNKSITITDTGLKTNLDTYINNGSTTNLDGISGINLYQIRPKIKMYSLKGRSTNNATNAMLGSAGSTFTIFDISNFGGWAAAKTFYGRLTGIGQTTTTITYDYVRKSDFALVEGATINLNTSAYSVLANDIISINRSYASSRYQSVNDEYHLAYSQSKTVATNGYVVVNNVIQDDSSFITIPAGYIGWISQLTAYSSASTQIGVIKWSGTVQSRETVYSIYVASNFSTFAGNQGSLGGIFEAGDTIGILRTVAAAESYVSCNVVIQSIL